MEETVKQETKTEEVETKTFTQDEVNRIIGERVARAEGKYSDYEELKAKAAKLDEIEEANKSELEKATEKANALQAELDGLSRTELEKNITALLPEINKEIPGYAQIRKIEFMPEDFERTPKRSIKRYLYQRNG